MRRVIPVLAGIALTAGLAAGPAHAAENPYERGPAPTESLIESARGPFATAETSVSRFAVSGFGGGTIYYPTSTSAGTFGGVAISPGFTASQSSMAWLGPRLASHGFVVIIIDTNSIYDQPSSRGNQLLAALDYLTQRSSVRARVDATRLGVAGHSMGGGGSLEAAKDRPSLKAAVPMTPWNTDKTWPEVTTPTFIVGGESDSVAPVGSHSEPFYQSLSRAREKAYMEIDRGSHFFPNSPHTVLAKYTLSWLKRFIDNDTRYDQFLCPVPNDWEIEEYRSSCPHA